MINLNIARQLEIAQEASMEAGKFLIDNSNNIQKVIFSNEKDIKIQADILSEKIIKDIIMSKSDFPILGEESGLSSDDLSNTFWVVDPLDGTANYIRGIPICCISIALISNLEPVLGVIYDFNNKNFYEGSIESKSLCNKVKISVSNISDPAEGVLITGLPNNTDYSEDAMKKMIKDFQSWRKVRMFGSAALASAYIASGKADAYSETKTYLWDVAAGAAIVNAAGGNAVISNFNDKFQVNVLFKNSSLSI